MDGTLRTLANQGYGNTNFRIVNNTVSSVSLDFTAVTSFITSVSPGLVIAIPPRTRNRSFHARTTSSMTCLNFARANDVQNLLSSHTSRNKPLRFIRISHLAQNIDTLIKFIIINKVYY